MAIRHVPPDLESCHAIFKALQGSPLASFFFDFSGFPEFPDSFFAAHPDAFPLAAVGERLSDGAYATPDAFCADVLAALDPFVDFYADDPTRDGRTLWGLACEVKERFLKLCKKSTRPLSTRILKDEKTAGATIAQYLRGPPLTSGRPWADRYASDGIPPKVDPVLYFPV